MGRRHPTAHLRTGDDPRDSMLEIILTSLCLVLVFEGIFPFLNPDGYKRTIKAMSELPDSQLRVIGLSSMIAGVVLLAIVR